MSGKAIDRIRRRHTADLRPYHAARVRPPRLRKPGRRRSEPTPRIRANSDGTRIRFLRMGPTRICHPLVFSRPPLSRRSATIGLDVVTVSRRLGHGSPAITLTVYAHKFASKDTAAAEAIEAAMGPGTRGASSRPTGRGNDPSKWDPFSEGHPVYRVWPFARKWVVEKLRHDEPGRLLRPPATPLLTPC